MQVVAGRLEWCVPFDRVVCPLRYLREWLQGELSGVSLSISPPCGGWCVPLRSDGVSPPMSFKGVRGRNRSGVVRCSVCSWRWAFGGFPFVGCRRGCFASGCRENWVVCPLRLCPLRRVVCPLRSGGVSPPISFKGVRGRNRLGVIRCSVCSWRWAFGGFSFGGWRRGCCAGGCRQN